MSEDWQAAMKVLLASCHIGFLATTGEYSAETSMAPFAPYQGKLLLHLSTLARHTSNLSHNPHAGFMICTPETMADSCLALPRLSLQGQVTMVKDADMKRAKACYVSRIPDAAPLFEFADFRLYQFSITHIQWVGGFGSARKISLKSWKNTICDIAPIPHALL